MVLLPLARTGSRPSHDSGRPSIEVRVDANSPAKSRMLWREGFTQHEIENSSMDAKEVKRQEVIFEIIHTEADYVRDLRIAVRVLLGPLRELRIVSSEQVDLLFGNIGEILALHEDINAAFMERQRIQYPVVWDISDVLLPFVARFRVYARYICNQDNALRLVEELRRTSHGFSVFWKERQQRPECRSLPMEAFLALPFQRLLKYPLLMRTLLATTEGWTQQHANGSEVAEQVDVWIRKIQDARLKLDSFACIDALSKCIGGVDWSVVTRDEHRLAHSGAVRTTNPHRAGNGAALPPDRAATMWLFDDFAVIASSSGTASGARSFMPGPGKHELIMGPCQIIEVLELAQCKGSPAAYLHAVPFQPHGISSMHAQKTSIVVRFASRADYTMWRSKLDAHVRRVLQEQPSLSADILAEAIARAQIVDRPPVSCLGEVRSPPSTGLATAHASAMASSSDIPTISVRDVYVQFPVPRQKGKLRRGWDFICSKTEDVTGQGIKRQLRKYGGGGGKRRVVEESPPAKVHRRMSRHVSRVKGSPLVQANPTGSAASLISTPLMGPPAMPSPALMSPSFVHVSKFTEQTAINGGREPAAHTLAFAPQPRMRSSFVMGTYHVPHPDARSSLEDSNAMRSFAAYSHRRSEDTMDGAPMQHDMLLSSMEFGSAARACANDPPMSSNTSLTGHSISECTVFAAPLASSTSLTDRTISALPSATYGPSMDDEMSDSEFSTSEISAMFPEHMAERSNSTLFNPQSPRHTISYSHLQQHAPQPRWSAMPKPLPKQPPKPLPIPPASRASRSGFSSRKPAPVFEFGSAKLTYGTGSMASGLKTWGTSANCPTDGGLHTMLRPPARNWQTVDADNPSSANSTDSFCIVSREPQPPVLQIRRQSAERGRRSQTFT
ncbi:hypothetical protein H4S00_000742 [Coemansia sp. D1744]|nr:hypothetical protein H4S00_000742 [Coemansia sp. D1744]